MPSRWVEVLSATQFSDQVGEPQRLGERIHEMNKNGPFVS